MSHSRSLSAAKEEFLSYYLSKLPQFADAKSLDHFLSLKNPPVIMFSPKFHDELISLWTKQHLTLHPLKWFPYCYYWPSEVQIGLPLPGFSQGWIYALNPSSLLPVLFLDPKPTDTILDASAAPGGKTLATLLISAPSNPFIVANDVSFPRFKRLKTTLKLFGYPNLLTIHSPIQSLIHTTDIRFDKILLDAPCSSEKHVYNSKQHLRIWSPSRSENLAHLQRLLIDSLIPLLNPNGSLIYSTCALNPQENESVINSVLHNYPQLTLETPPSTLPFHSPGLSGNNLTDLQRHLILRTSPLHTSFDPMFVAKLKV